MSGLDKKTMEKFGDEKYFAREKKSKKEKGEDAFMKQGEKPEVCFTSGRYSAVAAANIRNRRSSPHQNEPRTRSRSISHY